MQEVLFVIFLHIFETLNMWTVLLISYLPMYHGQRKFSEHILLRVPKGPWVPKDPGPHGPIWVPKGPGPQGPRSPQGPMGPQGPTLGSHGSPHGIPWVPPHGIPWVSTHWDPVAPPGNPGPQGSILLQLLDVSHLYIYIYITIYI